MAASCATECLRVYARRCNSTVAPHHHHQHHHPTVLAKGGSGAQAAFLAWCASATNARRWLVPPPARPTQPSPSGNNLLLDMNPKLLLTQPRRRALSTPPAPGRKPVRPEPRRSRTFVSCLGRAVPQRGPTLWLDGGECVLHHCGRAANLLARPSATEALSQPLRRQPRSGELHVGRRALTQHFPLRRSNV